MHYSPPGSSVQWDSPGKNTGVGCQFLLQGVFCGVVIIKRHSGKLYQENGPVSSTIKLQGEKIVAGKVYVYLFISFIFISWRLITLQYCSGFFHTLT